MIRLDNDTTIVMMAASAGLGALALHYLNGKEQRAAFLAWLDEGGGERFPRDYPPAVTIECAALALTGMHRALEGQAA